jgi:hypothetical protein
MATVPENKEYYESSSDESSSDESSSSESSSSESSSSESSSTFSLSICNKTIRQNSINGYISVNDITAGTGKFWSGYKNKKRTKKFIEEVEITTRIPKEKLITGKSNRNRWIHPYIAIHFCQWISPKLSVEISRFVYNFISSSFVPSEFTQYIQTISDNKKLKLNISSFKDENEKLKKELNIFKSSKILFERDNEKLKKELNIFKSSKILFERENEKFKNELTNLHLNITSFKNENERLNKKLIDLKSKIQSFENNNKKLKRKIKLYKNITIDKNIIKIKDSNKYKLSIENNILILTPI